MTRIARKAISSATKIVLQRRFASIRIRIVHVGGVFDKELAQFPVPMKGRAAEPKVVSSASSDSPLARRNLMALTSP